MAAEVMEWLAKEGIAAVEIGPDGPKRHDGVHVGTMHRFKGLEYQRLILQPHLACGVSACWRGLAWVSWASADGIGEDRSAGTGVRPGHEAVETRAELVLSPSGL